MTKAALDAIGLKWQAGDLAAAAALAAQFCEAVKTPEHQAPARFWLGMIAHREQRYAEALPHYEAARQYDAGNPQLLFQLGTVQGYLGDAAKAEASYQEALRLAPQFAHAHYNLGVLLQNRGELAGARRAFELAITHQPKLVQAHNNLGNVLLALNDTAGAQQCYQAALTIEPRFAHAWHALGLLRVRVHDPAGARGYFERAVAAAPEFESAWMDLADTCHTLGDTAAALTCLAEILARTPEHAIALFKRAQFSGTESPAEIPRELLERLYTGMAPTFDSHLTERLGYQIPTLLRETLVPWLKHRAEQPTVLDLGCGTGLFGAEIRAHAAKLVGVDLSPAMLEKAKGRGVYDELHVAELGDYLACEPRQFELISATDVLIYLGALETVFKQVHAKLAPDGLFAGSVETPEDVMEGFRLLPSGRFAHSMAYVESCAQAAGLVLTHNISTVIRLENGAPIAGVLFVVERRA